MKELTELCTLWKLAEQNYKTAKTSLDNSLEYILAREELNQARFRFDKACRDYVLEYVLPENPENVHEL